MIDHTEAKEHLKSLTLLLVEDEWQTQQMLREFLQRLVAVVITASNGVEGLDAYREHAPDIVLTDIKMPVMDGLTMVREIRSLGTGTTVPIFILTAFEEVDYIKTGASLGAEEFHSKPINTSKFVESLFRCAGELLGKSKRHVHADLDQ